MSDDLRCPVCDALLKNVENVPPFEIADERMHLDITCPGCSRPLTVYVELFQHGNITVRKYVEERESE